MSDYDLPPGLGSLKLKGVVDGGVTKKKKKKSKSSADRGKQDRLKELLFSEDNDAKAASGSSPNSPGVSGSGERKTEAEKRFEEVQKRRLAERVAKLANRTHKDRVGEFNAKLEALSEHHDIPKVGPG